MGRRDQSPQPVTPSFELLSVEDYRAQFGQNLQEPQVSTGEPQFIATSGWGDIAPPQVPTADQAYGGYTPDIPQQFGSQPLPLARPGLTGRLREYSRGHKRVTATAAALVLGVSLYAVYEHGSNQSATQTITTPHQDKKAAAPTAKPNAVANIAPDKVPDFVPQNVCADIANIAINSTIPVDWSAILYGKNNAKVWIRSSNPLTSNPVTIAGNSNVKWQVCLSANSTTADASGNPTKYITVDRKDANSMQNVTADMSKAVLIAYPQIDNANTSVPLLPSEGSDNYILAALQQKDPTNAAQDLNQLNGAWQSNKGNVIAAATNYLIAQTYVVNKDQLVKDARLVVKQVIGTQAEQLGIPDDKIAISVANGDPTDPTTPYSQAAQLTPGSVFNIRFDDPQKIQSFSYTRSSLIANQ